jgi:flagellar hook protein FlgE
VTFKLSQKEYINDFAKDYSYDFNGSVPPSTFIYTKFVMYDPTDEEGTKKEDFFNLEVVSSGQLASAFCNFGALSVVDGT